MKIDAKQAKEMMDTRDDIVVVDVRSGLEYEDAHIDRAINIPVNTILDTAESILKDKNQTILVHCRSGARSARATSILEELGYTSIYDFGGLNTWPYDLV